MPTTTVPKPLIILDPNGLTKAPILDYNLPQQTSFTTYSIVVLDKDKDTTPYKYKVDPARRVPAYAQRLLDGQSAVAVGGAFLTPVPTTNPTIILDDSFATDGFPVFALNGANSNQLRGLTQSSYSSAYGSGTPVSNPNPAPTPTAGLVDLPYAGLDINEVAAKARLGFAVRITEKFGGFEKDYEYVRRPIIRNAQNKLELTVLPQIFIVEEYKTTSFLGNYGAAGTLSTQSLFPGEKTKISLKTFREMSSVKANAENIIDSLSKESAAEMENLLENEVKKSNSSSTDATVSANVSFKVKFAGLSGGASASKTSKSSRESNARNLSKALSKHVDKSNSNREVKVNTNTEDKLTERDETAIEREFSNPNQSRVLNFVFRELLQEYISITYLNDIKIGFSNGHPEYDRIVPMEELDEFLATYLLNQADIDLLKARIKFEYGNIRSKGNVNTTTDLVFLEEVTVTTQETTTATGTTKYLSKKRTLEDSYSVAGGMTFKVPGIILNVDKNTLRTPAVVVDALLGQGEALDNYAIQYQEAVLALKEQEVEKARMEVEQLATANRQKDLAMTIIGSLTDPLAKADAYAKMLNPQQIINNI